MVMLTGGSVQVDGSLESAGPLQIAPGSEQEVHRVAVPIDGTV
jgi:hypothetical protein